jgi:hypothetical protein
LGKKWSFAAHWKEILEDGGITLEKFMLFNGAIKLLPILWSPHLSPGIVSLLLKGAHRCGRRRGAEMSVGDKFAEKHFDERHARLLDT